MLKQAGAGGATAKPQNLRAGVRSPAWKQGGGTKRKSSTLMSASDAEAFDAVMASSSDSTSWVALTSGSGRGAPKFVVADRGEEGGYAALRESMGSAAIVFGLTHFTVKYDHGRPANRVPLLIMSVGEEVTSALKRGRATADCAVLKKEYASSGSSKMFVYHAMHGEDLEENLMVEKIVAFYRGASVAF